MSAMKLIFSLSDCLKNAQGLIFHSLEHMGDDLLDKVTQDGIIRSPSRFSLAVSAEGI